MTFRVLDSRFESSVPAVCVPLPGQRVGWTRYDGNGIGTTMRGVVSSYLMRNVLGAWQQPPVTMSNDAIIRRVDEVAAVTPNDINLIVKIDGTSQRGPIPLTECYWGFD
jgi:hypothetical protein